MDNSINYTEVKPTKISKYFYYLLGLIIFHIVFNTIWIILNNQPPTWDSGLHTVKSFEMFKSFKDLLTISTYYPPFVHFIGSILVLIVGYSFKSTQITGTLFLSVALIYIYLYSKELFKNPKIAFFSSLFFSFFITIYEQSRYHMLDIPLTAMVFGSLYYLEKSNNLVNERFNLLFFLFFALATLTKWYAFIFILIPVLFKIFKIFKEAIYKKINIKNLFFGLLIFLILILPWYLVNLKSLLTIAIYTSTAELADPQRLFSIENLLFYKKLIIMFQTSFLGFIFFITSLVLFIKHSLKWRSLLLISILFIFLVFTMISNKNIRYIIPMMPFIAMIMAFGADWILERRKFLNTFLLSTTLSYLVISYFILSFGFPIYPNYKYAFNFPVIKWLDVYYLDDFPVKVIYEQNQKLPYSSIVEEISKFGKREIRILTLVDSPYINDYLLNPTLYFKDPKVQFSIIEYQPLSEVSDINQYLNQNADIVSKNYIGLEEGIREYKSLEKFHEYIISNKLKNFEKVKEYELVGDEYHPNDTIILMKKSF